VCPGRPRENAGSAHGGPITVRPPDANSETSAGYPTAMDLRAPLRWLGGRDDSSKAADQDNALIDTPEHSDVVEDDDVLADEGGPRPTRRFRRLQRKQSPET
jgi:hypothetical protein